MLSRTHIRPPSSRGRIARASTLALFVVANLVAPALFAGTAVAAQAPVGLGTADNFAVLAGQTVTNTGPSVITGDVGVSPGTAVVGLVAVTGTIHAGDAAADRAQSDLTTAYDDAAGRTPPVVVAADLGGLTLAAGVYSSASSLGLTGTLTLDAQGDPDAVFVFQAGSTLTTAAMSQVNLINGAQACNVFWQIGSSATLGTASGFAGNILALTSISLSDGVTVQGRALARNGSVTLINDTITVAHCAPGTTGGSAGSPPEGSVVGKVSPVPGKSVTVEVRTGTVRVKEPGARSYVALSRPASVAFGSLIDTRAGSVNLRSARSDGAEQSAIFHGGLFEVRQPPGGGGQVELVLRGALPGCTANAARAASSRPRARRRLWGHDDHGQFRTRGSNSVTSVRGTAWYVEDRCDGTLTRVSAGRVSVYDSRRRLSVLVRAGHSYLARKAPGPARP